MGGFDTSATLGGLTTMFWKSWSNTPSYFQIGTSNTAASATQTCLQAYSKTATAFYSTGNSISWNSNGNCVATVKQSFASESGSASYNEAGQLVLVGGAGGALQQNSPSASGGTTSTYVLMNRVVFPSSINVTVGQTIIMTMAVTIPTLYNNPATVTLTAQNGINLSGQMNLVGTTAYLQGGSVTTGGTYTANNQWPVFPNIGTGTASLNGNHVFALTGHNSLIAAGTNGTNMASGTTNSVVAAAASVTAVVPYTNGGSFAGTPYTTGVGGSYPVGGSVTGSAKRSLAGVWNPGNPASNTTYYSVMFADGGVSGYQLLLSSGQTFSNNATFIYQLDFGLS